MSKLSNRSHSVKPEKKKKPFYSSKIGNKSSVDDFRKEYNTTNRQEKPKTANIAEKPNENPIKSIEENLYKNNLFSEKENKDQSSEKGIIYLI